MSSPPSNHPTGEAGAARIRLALAAFGLLVLGASAFGLCRAHRADQPPVVVSLPSPSPAGADTPPASPPRTDSPRLRRIRAVPARLYVHVAGAVRHPWLYALPPGSRVMQAVLAAGGPAPLADLDAVNLAEPVRDGEKVYIPTRRDLDAQRIVSAPPGNVIGHASVLPDTIPPATAPTPPATPSLPTVIEPGGPGDTGTAAAPAATVKAAKRRGAGKSDKITSPDQGQIPLNSADAAQLERLPGVGPAMAARILAFRTQAHGFQSIDELQEVSGIGPKKYAKIKNMVTLDMNVEVQDGAIR